MRCIVKKWNSVSGTQWKSQSNLSITPMRLDSAHIRQKLNFNIFILKKVVFFLSETKCMFIFVEVITIKTNIMTTQELNNWNGKTYNNAIYLSSQKITDANEIKKVKAFHIIKKNALDAITDIKNQKKCNESSLLYLQGKYDQLIYEALCSGLIYFENAFVLDNFGYQFITSIYDDLNSGKLYTIENTPKEIIQKEITL